MSLMWDPAKNKKSGGSYVKNTLFNPQIIKFYLDPSIDRSINPNELWLHLEVPHGINIIDSSIYMVKIHIY